MLPHGKSYFSAVQMASIDHAMWFHRDASLDDWLLYAQDSPSASGARGFSRGLIFSRDGVLVASVAQEGLIRPRDLIPHAPYQVLQFAGVPVIGICSTRRGFS